MPKIIELTVELEVQKVSCPGVWLCQDGRVSLTVFALGTSYQTCMLPPVFPLMFRDVFYFRKRFQESCSLNNICCILKEETIYCELVQWSNNCAYSECTVLAQYLGAINDVLFPPNMCSNDGVDLLMRRSKEFPGILSPKIEIATKVRIDEVWDQPCNMKSMKVTSCHCSSPDSEGSRQRQVCHSAQYHRSKCTKTSKRAPSVTPTRSRSRSGGSRSCCSFTQEPEQNPKVSCECRTPASKSRTSLSRTLRSRPRRRQYSVYSAQASAWPRTCREDAHIDEGWRSSSGSDRAKPPRHMLPNEERIQKLILESRYIEQEPVFESKLRERERHKHFRTNISPCVCEICRRYHELFHSNISSS